MPNFSSTLAMATLAAVFTLFIRKKKPLGFSARDLAEDFSGFECVVEAVDCHGIVERGGGDGQSLDECGDAQRRRASVRLHVGDELTHERIHGDAAAVWEACEHPKRAAADFEDARFAKWRAGNPNAKKPTR